MGFNESAHGNSQREAEYVIFTVGLGLFYYSLKSLYNWQPLSDLQVFVMLILPETIEI